MLRTIVYAYFICSPSLVSFALSTPTPTTTPTPYPSEITLQSGSKKLGDTADKQELTKEINTITIPEDNPHLPTSNPNVTSEQPNDDHLVAWWKFDELQGVVKDESGQGNHGKVISVSRGRPSIFGNSFSWNGDDIQYVESNDFFDLWDPGSISLWYKSDDIRYEHSYVFLSKWDNQIERGWSIRLYRNHFEFVYRNPPDNYYHWISDRTFTDTSDWHHLVTVLDGRNFSTFQMYLDGKILSGSWSRVPSNNSIGSTTAPVRVGIAESNVSFEQMFDGSMDQIRMYNSLLNENNVQWLYNERLYTRDLPEGLDWVFCPSSGNYYATVETRLSWYDANEYAESIGAHLATFTSPAEENCVETLLGSNFGWIGLYVDRFKNVAWITQEPLEYTDWIPNQPDYQGLTGELNGVTRNERGWNDGPAEESLHFTIEFEGTSIEPTPTPSGVYFHNGSLVENNLSASVPNGYRLGHIRMGEILDEDSMDGTGLKIDLNPGQGFLLFSLDAIDAPDMMEITSRIKTSNSEASVALIALNSSLDGQYSFINLTSNALPIGEFKDVKLFYQPPEGQMLLGIQAVNSPFSSVSTSIYVDEIVAGLYESGLETVINTELDGSFDNGFGNILVNFNDATGVVQPIFNSFEDIDVSLSLQSKDRAANIGTFALDSNRQIPANLFGRVNLTRDTNTEDGIISMVVTNGIQTYSVFRQVSELPVQHNETMETLFGGGSFYVDNPSIPITLVVQNGGQDIESTVIVDDLYLLKR